MDVNKDLKTIGILLAIVALGCGLLGAALGVLVYSRCYIPPVVPQWVSRVTRLLVDGNADLATVRCQGHTTQTAAILTVEQSDGTDVFAVDNSGNVLLTGYVSDEDSPVTFADNVLVDGYADAEQLVAQGYTTQTNFIVVVEQSDGTDVFTIDNDGDTVISGTLTISDAIAFAGDLDMGNNVIENIGAAGTDFVAGGSLQTAQSITISSGGISVTGASTFNDDIDMVNNEIANIGAAGTDFQDDGGLITASTITVTAGGLVIVAGDLTLENDELIQNDVNGTVSLNIAGADEWDFTADQLDATNGQIVNIGAAGTDFGDDGSLTTAQTITVTAGGLVVVAGTADLNAGIALDDTAFTVADTTGNTVISGTLTVTDTSDFVGNVVITGTLDVDSDTNITDRLTVTIASASDVGLTVRAASSQSANVTEWQDSSGTPLVWINGYGRIRSDVGYRGVAKEWADSFVGWSYGTAAAEHSFTNDAGYFDYTGNVSGTMIFTDTTNSPFTQADEDASNWIVIRNGSYLGAKAEIEKYLDASTVVLHSDSWDGDLSGIDYGIHKAPQMFVGDDYDTHFHAGAEGTFEVHTVNEFTGDEAALGVRARAGADDIVAAKAYVDARGYDRVMGLEVRYEAGQLEAETGFGVHIALDDTAAITATTATKLVGVRLHTTDEYTATKYAVEVGAGFDYALRVMGASSADVEYGYEVTSASVVTRTDEFTDTNSDIEIFDNDDDYILIGSDNTFEIIAVYLDVVSSKDCELAFYYSKAGGAWTALTVNLEGTNGFQQSGQIVFDAPGDWAKDDEAEANGDITNAYYIKIMRTYDFYIPTLPTEDYFKIYAAQSTGMNIRGDGVMALPYLAAAPANLVNGMMWMEADGLHIYYAGAEALVSDGVP